jgi:predicted SprT family Zn-dependent metalloprotease
MRLHEFSNISLEEGFLKNGILSAALAASTVGAAYNIHKTTPQDAQLTSLGQSMIKDMPSVLQHKLGNVNDIKFVSGIPDGGDPNAIAQVEQGSKIVYINPKYINQFKNGDADQIVQHELTHIAQQNNIKYKNSDNPHDYEGMDNLNIWPSLQKMRNSGDTMKNHTREAQAMIVQQRVAQVHMLNNLINSNKKDNYTLNAIKLCKSHISLADEYISDFNN